MTLTICIKSKDGIVLASDSKASSILTSNDTVKKIFKLDEHHAIGIAGDGPLAINIFDQIFPKLNFRHGIKDVAEQLRLLCKEKFNDYFDHQAPKERPGLSILLAGYTNKGEPEIYQLSSNDNFAPRKSPTGFDSVGIPVIAEYLLNTLYEPEIETENASALATFCIKETSSQDNRVGGPTQISTFSNEKNYSELSAEEVSKIEKNCEQFRLIQKGLFYPEDDTSGATRTKEAQKQ